MKVLVTGASGFVGSHLVDLLIKENHRVSCLIRKSSSTKWLKDKDVVIKKGDLNDKSNLKNIIKDFDVIYHIAGRTFGRSYSEFYEANAIGTKNLIETAYENIPNLKRFVYLSSQTVGGPSKSLDKPVDESITPTPITSYGKSKLEGEIEVSKFVGKFPITILRAPAIYGPRDNAILAVFQSVNYGLGTLMGFNEKYISLLHVDDIVNAAYTASISDKTINNKYYLSSDRFYTWKEVISVIKSKLNKKLLLYIRIPHFLILFLAKTSELIGNMRGKPPVFNYEKGIDFIQQYWTCSSEKANEDFGFKQKVSLEEGVENTVNWYREEKLL